MWLSFSKMVFDLLVVLEWYWDRESDGVMMIVGETPVAADLMSTASPATEFKAMVEPE